MTRQACAWTDEQIETLTRLWADGLSCSLIGEAMGITRNAVIGKVHRLKLPKRRTTDRISGWKWMNVSKRSKWQSQRATTRAERAKPKPKVKLQRVSVPKPKPQPVEFTADVWEPLAWATPVTLEHVTGCRWPASDPFAPVGSVDLFCNCKPLEGKSYCPEHQARSTGKGTAGEKSAVSWGKNYAMKEAA